jgi:hypothetical protein
VAEKDTTRVRLPERQHAQSNSQSPRFVTRDRCSWSRASASAGASCLDSDGSFDFVVDCGSDSRHTMHERIFAEDRCAPDLLQQGGRPLLLTSLWPTPLIRALRRPASMRRAHSHADANALYVPKRRNNATRKIESILCTRCLRTTNIVSAEPVSDPDVRKLNEAGANPDSTQSGCAPE